jgi:hypothetical protein
MAASIASPADRSAVTASAADVASVIPTWEKKGADRESGRSTPLVRILLASR